MSEQKSVEKKKKKKFKFGKLIIILLIVAAVGLWIYSASKKAVDNLYVEEIVQRRDICTYHSFNGTVEPVTEQNIIADLSGVKITELLVEEGDTIKAGDPVMYLDSEAIENSIEDLQTSMAAQAQTTDISITSAQTNYYNYRSDLANGLNAQILSAQTSVENAAAQVATAQRNVETQQRAVEAAERKYNETVTNTENNRGDAIREAQNGIDSAYQNVRLAQIALETADHNMRVASSDEARFQAEQAYEQAERNLETAWRGYNNAQNAMEIAKRENNSGIDAAYDNFLNTYDQLVAAQATYLSAIDAYNTAEANLTIVQRSTEETLQGYRIQYEQALANSDTSVNELRLLRYEDQLEDCVVYAPLSGTITQLNVKEGDMITTGTVLGVVTDFDEMKVTIRINEYDILGASEGEHVELTLNALNEDYEGVITKISRTAKVSNGVSYFDSEVEFIADENVRSGMSVEVRLLTNDLKDVLTIPSRAVQIREDGTAYVLVPGPDGKGMEQRDVSCGATDGTYIEVTEGLEEGETILYIPMSMEEMQTQLMME